MYVTAGAQEKLLRQEREKFLAEDWPRIMQQVEALGLDVTELLNKEAGK